jgi:hypothetical protein
MKLADAMALLILFTYVSPSTALTRGKVRIREAVFPRPLPINPSDAERAWRFYSSGVLFL